MSVETGTQSQDDEFESDDEMFATRKTVSLDRRCVPPVIPPGRRSLVQRTRSEGYVENYQMHTAAAISQVAQASVKKASRRISVGFQKGKGLRVSVEDLRQRKTRVVCLGSENVGKSAFVVKFVTRRFIHEYLHHQNSRYVHEMEFKDGNRHRFEILDLSSRVEHQLSSSEDDHAQSEFENHLRWGDVFFLMFSITDRASFNELTRLTFLVNLLHKAAFPKPLIIIIGTKSDLERNRSISTDEGRDLAHQLNARYYEISTQSQDHDEIVRIFKESADILRVQLTKSPLLHRKASNSSLSRVPSFNSRISSTVIKCGEHDSLML